MPGNECCPESHWCQHTCSIWACPFLSRKPCPANYLGNMYCPSKDSWKPSLPLPGLIHSFLSLPPNLQYVSFTQFHFSCLSLRKSRITPWSFTLNSGHSWSSVEMNQMKKSMNNGWNVILLEDKTSPKSIIWWRFNFSQHSNKEHNKDKEIYRINPEITCQLKHLRAFLFLFITFCPAAGPYKQTWLLW